ncbi:MAG: ABC transporter ATP-binding protein [Chloroflexota bacterium]|nr:ABC transporter ATP-binding protein [Chloroflexota bacterium]
MLDSPPLLEMAVRCRLGEFTLDAELVCARGPLVIIGPSGAGKSAALRAIAGVLRPDAGRIAVNGRLLLDTDRGIDVPPQSRGVGYVPQDYALFPHLSVEGNIGFGLRSLGREERRRRVDEMVALTGLAGQRGLRPKQLSGGQRQRAALARALAVRPEVLLLDEPFAALDAPTRASLLEEVRSLIARTETATVFVTHDRHEALRLGDTIAVMMGGRIRQAGSPAEAFGSPVDEEVAAFVGVETIAPGRVRSVVGGVAVVDIGGQIVEGGIEAGAGRDVLVCLRPEDVTLSAAGVDTPATSARNRLCGRVVRATPFGPYVRVEVDVGFALVALITKQSLEDLALMPGSEVLATFKASAVHLIRR